MQLAISKNMKQSSTIMIWKSISCFPSIVKFLPAAIDNMLRMIARLALSSSTPMYSIISSRHATGNGPGFLISFNLLVFSGFG